MLAQGIETEFLIVGAGPAGGSMVCFLASYGLKGILINSASSTAETPRAHITNMATFECFRDIGIEEELLKASSDGSTITHTRWCQSMAGEEYARIYSMGNDPARRGDYDAASPCNTVDLPQTLLEPALVRYATTHGFQTRFDTTFVDLLENTETGGIVVTVRDELTKTEYQITTKYLFGADGARSQVLKRLQLPLSIKPRQGGVMTNVVVKTDLSHLIRHRAGNLHWVMQPDRVTPEYGGMCVVRMVRPWNEWIFNLFPGPNFDPKVEVSRETLLSHIRAIIGDDTPAEIVHVSRWYINDTVAETFSKGNVFCLGDAVHRHPPPNGLGSNTSIQDSFNLAWKIAYVHTGRAAPSLLDTYSIERQPVARGVVQRANDALRAHLPIWEALGLTPGANSTTAVKELAMSNEEGKARRVLLRKGIGTTAHEFHALGTEMGQRYEGAGVYLLDEEGPFVPGDRAARDPVLYYEASTYPGCRLPHAWLNTAVPGTAQSTIDLAGHGYFSLFTGIGGEAWRKAAEVVGREIGVDIKVQSIGFRQDWEDVYFRWEEVRGVEESGCVLVRPDRVVAWRATVALGPSVERLRVVMRAVLGLKQTRS